MKLKVKTLSMRQFVIPFVIAFLFSFLFLQFWQDTVAQRGYPLGFDIYLRWEAVRAFWRGQSPYSSEVTARADLDIYGRSRNEDEIAYAFYDPAYAAVVLSPLMFVPLAWVGTIWSALGLAMLIVLMAHWSWQLKPRPKPWVWGLIIISGLLYRPAIMTIINGQYSLFLAGCAAIAWWLIVRKKDFPAGIVLAISTIKPSIFLFVPFVIMLWALRWKRWPLIIGFAGTLTALGIVTLVKIGWWVPEFLSSLDAYNRTLGKQIEFSWSLNNIFSPPGLLWLLQSITLLVIGLRRMYRSNEFPWLACFAALNINLISSPHIVEYDLGILLLPLLWFGTEWAKYRWGMAALIFLLWLPWTLWFIVIGLGGTTFQWQNLVWRVFPNLLLVCTWVWLKIKNEPLLYLKEDRALKR